MIDVAIIGAGPYGLSLAAHLRPAKLTFRVFGKPMESWAKRMPPGMFLKSHPWSSCLYDPEGELTLEAFCRSRGIAYHDSTMEVPLELYCRYGESFQKTIAPDVAEKKLVALSAAPDGFRARFDDGEVVNARRIVLAVGVHPFAHVPEVLAGLPADVVSHSSEFGPMDRLEGREVIVVGSGASAIDLAALLHERGVSTTLLSRSGRLRFASPPPRGERPLLRQLARPGCGIGAGWLLWVCANAPWLIHRLPGPVRRALVRNTLGPLGGASMERRVIGKLPMLLGWEIDGADLAHGRVELRVRNRKGDARIVTADQVIAATGFRIDLDRLAFLDPDLRRRIRTVDGAPALSADYETSVPGLHVIGPASADSFGPVARFVFGAVYPARRLARRLSADLDRESSLLQREPSLAAAEG